MTTYGLKAFRYIELSNVEDTKGGTEAGVELALGSTITLPLEYITWATFEDEERGYLLPNMSDPVAGQYEANLTWEGPANDRQIQWPLAMSVCEPSIVTNAWAYQPDFDTPGNEPDSSGGIETFTINYGDNIQAYETSYCFGRRLSISGTPGDLVRFSCDITGRTVTTTTFDSPAAAAVEYFPFGLVEFYMDVSGLGNAGSTQVYYLKGFTWTLDTGFSPHYTASGQRYFYDVTEDKKAPELELVLARCAAVDTLWDHYVAGTQHCIRIKCMSGGAVGTYFIQLDGEYQFVSWDTGEEDGLSTHTVRCAPVWDSGSSNSWRVNTNTSMTAWPT